MPDNPTEVECCSRFGDWVKARCLKRTSFKNPDGSSKHPFKPVAIDLARHIKSASTKDEYKAAEVELQWLVKTIEDPDWT